MGIHGIKALVPKKKGIPTLTKKKKELPKDNKDKLLKDKISVICHQYKDQYGYQRITAVLRN